MIAIRRSRPDDVRALLAIWREAVDATHDFLAASDRAAIDAVVARDYLPAASLLVAVDEHDRPRGFLGGNGRAIDALFVAPDKMGAGVGGALIAEFDRSGQGPLLVDVNEANLRALAFYRARGFTVVARSPTDHDGRPYPSLHLRRD